MMGNHVDFLWSDKFEIHEKWQLLLVKRKTCSSCLTIVFGDFVFQFKKKSEG